MRNGGSDAGPSRSGAGVMAAAAVFCALGAVGLAIYVHLVRPATPDDLWRPLWIFLSAFCVFVSAGGGARLLMRIAARPR